MTPIRSKDECAVCGHPTSLRGLYWAEADRHGQPVEIVYPVCSRECANEFSAEMRRVFGVRPTVKMQFANGQS